MSTHHHEKLMIPGPAGHLQALFQPGDPCKPAVVVCHPHPLYGGTMRNKVVYWLARVFEDLGCSVLRFNFRGVEQSEGTWSGAEGEIGDVAAALDWMEKKYPLVQLWLAGFSFGTYVGLKHAAADPRVQRMFVVAPAVNLWSFDFMEQDKRPLTVVSGMADEIVPFEQVKSWVETLPHHVRFHAIDGAGHFFPDHMSEMMEAVRQDIPISSS